MSAAAIFQTSSILLPVLVSKPLWAVAERLLLACADTVPIALRMVMGKSFPQGPFKLGMPQPVINMGAIIYMIVSVVRLPPALRLIPANQARSGKMTPPEISPVKRAADSHARAVLYGLHTFRRALKASSPSQEEVSMRRSLLARSAGLRRTVCGR